MISSTVKVGEIIHTVMFTCSFLEEGRVVQIIEQDCIYTFILEDFRFVFTSNKDGDRLLVADSRLEKSR